jgi:hypothetical protein
MSDGLRENRFNLGVAGAVDPQVAPDWFDRLGATEIPPTDSLADHTEIEPYNTGEVVTLSGRPHEVWIGTDGKKLYAPRSFEGPGAGPNKISSVAYDLYDDGTVSGIFQGHVDPTHAIVHRLVNTGAHEPPRPGDIPGDRSGRRVIDQDVPPDTYAAPVYTTAPTVRPATGRWRKQPQYSFGDKPTEHSKLRMAMTTTLLAAVVAYGIPATAAAGLGSLRTRSIEMTDAKPGNIVDVYTTGLKFLGHCGWIGC